MAPQEKAKRSAEILGLSALGTESMQRSSPSALLRALGRKKKKKRTFVKLMSDFLLRIAHSKDNYLTDIRIFCLMHGSQLQITDADTGRTSKN